MLAQVVTDFETRRTACGSLRLVPSVPRTQLDRVSTRLKPEGAGAAFEAASGTYTLRPDSAVRAQTCIIHEGVVCGAMHAPAGGPCVLHCGVANATDTAFLGLRVEVASGAVQVLTLDSADGSPSSLPLTSSPFATRAPFTCVLGMSSGRWQLGVLQPPATRAQWLFRGELVAGNAWFPVVRWARQPGAPASASSSLLRVFHLAVLSQPAPPQLPPRHTPRVRIDLAPRQSSFVVAVRPKEHTRHVVRVRGGCITTNNPREVAAVTLHYGADVVIRNPINAWNTTRFPSFDVLVQDLRASLDSIRVHPNASSECTSHLLCSSQMVDTPRLESRWAADVIAVTLTSYTRANWWTSFTVESSADG